MAWQDALRRAICVNWRSTPHSKYIRSPTTPHPRLSVFVTQLRDRRFGQRGLHMERSLHYARCGGDLKTRFIIRVIGLLLTGLGTLIWAFDDLLNTLFQ